VSHIVTQVYPTINVTKYRVVLPWASGLVPTYVWRYDCLVYSPFPTPTSLGSLAFTGLTGTEAEFELAVAHQISDPGNWLLHITLGGGATSGYYST